MLVENDEQIVVINIMLNFDGKFNREFRLRIEKMNKKKTNKKKTNWNFEEDSLGLSESMCESEYVLCICNWEKYLWNQLVVFLETY